MDRRVKERLVGAAILVAIVILVVPELLSGPKSRPAAAPAIGVNPSTAVRNVTVDLATSKAMPATDDSAAAVSASAPAPADSPPAGAVVEAASAVAAATTVPLTAARSSAAAAAVAAPAAQPHWTVQFGSFASKSNAEKLLRRVREHDPSAYVASSGNGPGLRYRVRVGPLAERAAAERVAAKFKKLGMSASAVPP